MSDPTVDEAQARLARLIAKDPEAATLVDDIIHLAREYQRRGLTKRDLIGALEQMQEADQDA